MLSKKIESLLASLPSKPGVYKFKDEEGRVLYVGKAKFLNKRVRSYFRNSKEFPIRTKKLVENIADIEWIEVESEWEALVLESNLIKEFRPKYNVLLKDDKNFVYIKITKDEDYPRVKIVRKVEKDKARYFGPKTSAHQVEKTLTLLQKLFLFRSCDLEMKWTGRNTIVTKKTIAYPCLDFHIKRCNAPCTSNVSPEEYMEGIKQVENFLDGKTAEIEEKMKIKMAECVKNKNFEKAAILRDRLSAILNMQKKQLVSSPAGENLDVINFVLERGKAYFNLFEVRDGKLTNQENFLVDAPGFESGDERNAQIVLESFLFQYYLKAMNPPEEVIVPLGLDEKEFFIDWLSEECGRKITVSIPQKGNKIKQLELSKKNAISFFKQQQARFYKNEERDRDALRELKDVLSLKSEPKRIECYDISHLGGTDTVSSMVVFEDGKPKSADYRKFRLKSIEDGEIDDYKSMKETLERRLKKISIGPKNVQIRRANEKNRQKVEELQINNYELEKLEDIENYYLAYMNKKPVGMVAAVPFKGEVHLIKSLFVLPEFRENGVGSKLIKYIVNKIKTKRFYLGCYEDNVDFYEKSGFEIIKTYPKGMADEFERYKSVCTKGESVVLALDPKKVIDSSFETKPNLIVIDGGKGQLSVAKKIMDELGLNIPMISLAKREEEIFIPGAKKSKILPKNSESLKLLQRIRDEAHRFAISYQKNTRKKHLTFSELDNIEGVGEKLKMKLLKKFRSVEVIKTAKKSDLHELTGEKIANNIISHFNK